MLELRSVSKAYGAKKAVDDVSLRLETGQVLALLGPSGSGKSTLLGLIAGLEAPDRGDILWDARSVVAVPTHRRGFGLMFQDYSLFPHKDVAGNVGFGLKMRAQPRAAIEARVRQALEWVGLAGFERRDVSTLSGGEQQRVALARALAPEPRLLMLDEPLGALDRALRERLLDELHGLLRRLRQTAIYVTHDQEEAFALAHQVAILQAGRVAQQGTPADVYARPASRFVAEFLGLRNILPARLERRGLGWVAVTPAGELPLDGQQPGPGTPDGLSHVLVRPEGARLTSPDEADGGAPPIRAVVTDKSFRGSRNVVALRAGEAHLTLEFPASQAVPEAGQAVGLRLEPGAVHLLPSQTELTG